MPSQRRLQCPARQQVGATLTQTPYMAAAASNMQSVVAVASPLVEPDA